MLQKMVALEGSTKDSEDLLTFKTFTLFHIQTVIYFKTGNSVTRRRVDP